MILSDDRGKYELQSPTLPKFYRGKSAMMIAEDGKRQRGDDVRLWRAGDQVVASTNHKFKLCVSQLYSHSSKSQNIIEEPSIEPSYLCVKF
jgi:hypothetical protein